MMAMRIDVDSQEDAVVIADVDIVLDELIRVDVDGNFDDVTVDDDSVNEVIEVLLDDVKRQTPLRSNTDDGDIVEDVVEVD